MSKSTKKSSSDHICSGCNHNFSSTYTLNRHITSSKCGLAQNKKSRNENVAESVSEIDDNANTIAQMESRIKKLVLQNKKLKAKLKAEKKDENETNDSASVLSARVPKKLQNISIEETEPFTKDYLQENLTHFTLSKFKKGARGVAEFILELAKQNGDNNIATCCSIACTDVSRHKFYVLSKSDDGRKFWTLDSGGGLNVINFVLDELRVLADKYLDKLEDSQVPDIDKYIGMYDAIGSEVFTPIRDKIAQKIRAVLKENLCI